MTQNKRPQLYNENDKGNNQRTFPVNTRDRLELHLL